MKQTFRKAKFLYGESFSTPKTSTGTNGRTKPCCLLSGYGGNAIMYKKGDKGHLKHGLRNTRLYRIWANIKTRCYNENDPHFERLGKRGIKMCDEWRNDFKVFYDWSMSHGYSDELTIDRIDNDGNYEPKNCRWTTIKEQNKNKRNVKYITYAGKTQTIPEWTKELRFGKETIRERLKRGYTDYEALFGR